MSRTSPAGGSAAVGRRLAALERRVISCRLCPRLVEYREHIGEVKRPRYSGWEYWARPVPGFGDPSASLMIVGLAPAAHGANRTGRLFSGDLSAKFLMAALYQTGFANQPTSEHRGDGLELRDAYICAAVRCVPPGDRPTIEEQRACLPYLVSEMGALPRVRTILVLGHVAFRACLRALERIKGEHVKGAFSHGAWYDFGVALPRVVASYHPSPRNTNTGRLSKDGFVALLQDIRQSLSG